MKYVAAVMVVCITCLLASSVYAQSDREKIRKANELFKAEQYEEALNLYRDAELDNPESAKIWYNIGNTFYKQEKFEEAFKEYIEVLTAPDADLQFRSYYNMGNALYRMDELERSILSYTEALRRNPDDFESKSNLEFVRNKLKEQSNNEKSGRGQEDREEQDQQQQQQEKRDQEQQQDEKQEQGDQQNPADQEPRRQEQKEDQNISREEAERILNALQNDEKDLLQQRSAGKKSNVRVKKPW